MREDDEERSNFTIDQNYLCCHGHAHIKTAAQTVAYFELVALTSLLSYLFASYMVYGYSSLITFGLLFGLIQAVFIFSLIYGINSERGKFLIPNFFALCFVVICLFIHIVIVLYACLDNYPNLNSLRKSAAARIILSIILSILITISMRALYRCYCYFCDLEKVRLHSSTGMISIQSGHSGRSVQVPTLLNVEDLPRNTKIKKIDFAHRQSIYYEATEDFDDRSDAGMSKIDSVEFCNFPNPIPIIFVNGMGSDGYVYDDNL